MRLAGWLWLFILLGCLSRGMAAGWEAHPQPGAVVFVHPGQQSLARDIGNIVTAELPRIAADLGMAKAGPFPIYIYTNRTEFLRDAGPTPYLRGVSYSPTGLIRLDAGGSQGPVRQVLAHELTHSLLNQRLGQYIADLPTWVNEGLAGHFSEPISADQLPAASRQMHQEGILTPDELDAAFHQDHNNGAAYLQSRSMIAWLEYRHPGALRQLLARMAGGESFDDALQSSAGLTVKTWWEQWQGSIPSYMYLLYLLGSPVVYAPVALIVVLIAILRIRKRREELANVEDEDEEDEEEPPRGEDA